MKRIKVQIVAVVVVLAFSGLAHASHISPVDTAFGTNTGTYDARTNLTWLDLNITAGRAFTDILTDSTFSAWRHATVSEVVEIANDFDLPIQEGAHFFVPATDPLFGDLRGRFLSFGDVVGYSWAREMTATELGFNRLIS